MSSSALQLLDPEGVWQPVASVTLLPAAGKLATEQTVRELPALVTLQTPWAPSAKVDLATTAWTVLAAPSSATVVAGNTPPRLCTDTASPELEWDGSYHKHDVNTHDVLGKLIAADPEQPESQLLLPQMPGAQDNTAAQASAGAHVKRAAGDKAHGEAGSKHARRSASDVVISSAQPAAAAACSAEHRGPVSVAATAHTRSDAATVMSGLAASGVQEQKGLEHSRSAADAQLRNASEARIAFDSALTSCSWCGAPCRAKRTGARTQCKGCAHAARDIQAAVERCGLTYDRNVVRTAIKAADQRFWLDAEGSAWRERLLGDNWLSAEGVFATTAAATANPAEGSHGSSKKDGAQAGTGAAARCAQLEKHQTEVGRSLMNVALFKALEARNAGEHASAPQLAADCDARLAVEHTASAVAQSDAEALSVREALSGGVHASAERAAHAARLAGEQSTRAALQSDAEATSAHEALSGGGRAGVGAAGDAQPAAEQDARTCTRSKTVAASARGAHSGGAALAATPTPAAPGETEADQKDQSTVGHQHSDSPRADAAARVTVRAARAATAALEPSDSKAPSAANDPDATPEFVERVTEGGGTCPACGLHNMQLGDDRAGHRCKAHCLPAYDKIKGLLRRDRPLGNVYCDANARRYGAPLNRTIQAKLREEPGFFESAKWCSGRSTPRQKIEALLDEPITSWLDRCPKSK